MVHKKLITLLIMISYIISFAGFNISVHYCNNADNYDITITYIPKNEAENSCSLCAAAESVKNCCQPESNSCCSEDYDQSGRSSRFESEVCCSHFNQFYSAECDGHNVFSSMNISSESTFSLLSYPKLLTVSVKTQPNSFSMQVLCMQNDYIYMLETILS